MRPETWRRLGGGIFLVAIFGNYSRDRINGMGKGAVLADSSEDFVMEELRVDVLRMDAHGA